MLCQIGWWVLLALPTDYSLQAVVHWGYGCGGHCAFNFSGKSQVVLSLHADQTVTVRDAGEFTRQENYPDGIVFDTKVWDFSWNGSWKEQGGAKLLRLASDKLSCRETNTRGKKEQAVKCDGPAALVLKCSIRKVKVEPPENTPGPSGNGLPAAVHSPPKRFCGTVPCEDDLKAELEANGRNIFSCQPDQADYAGSAFPWVFGLGEHIQTVTSGPFAETSYRLESGESH